MPLVANKAALPCYIGALAVAFMAVGPCAAKETPPDTVFLHGLIATSDEANPQAQAMAVLDGRIEYVGTDERVKAIVGPRTRVIDLKGRRVIPGLVDAHVHPVTVVDPGLCSFEDKPQTLAVMSRFVRECARRHPGKRGEWLTIALWNSYGGNEPDARHPNVRRALDLAVPNRPVELLGDDGHHFAFNSAALALARDPEGKVVGLSARTLRKEFEAIRKLVGVDAAGEPDGAITEEAAKTMNPPDENHEGVLALAHRPEKMVRVFLEKGITAVLDAYVTPEIAGVYDALLKRHKMNMRANLAVFLDPEKFRHGSGPVDYDTMIAQAGEMRDHFAKTGLVRADVAKIFADGGMEGNPQTDPPTLPNSPMLRPYLQPIFKLDARGKPVLTGYVDLDGAACKSLPAAGPDALDPAQAKEFEDRNGFHPAQCKSSSGRLQHDEQIILDYARHLHLAGFTLHIHVIGDRAVKVAVDAIEGARAADGKSDRPDTLAHLQLVSPDDIVRIGHDHLFLAMTYSWADTEPGYDAQVIPFIDRVRSLSYADLHAPDNYYERQAYPARSLVDAGGIAAAGSDANVETRDPRPFFNMQVAVTRARNGTPALNARQSLSLQEVFRAYTIDGARCLGRGHEIGSLAIGKSADFAILDQDFFAVPIERVGATRVLETWFQGRKVYDSHPH